MENITVHSWDELQRELFATHGMIKSGDSALVMSFRGLSSASYRLETTLIRLRGDYVRLERHLLRNFPKICPPQLCGARLLWHWLSVAQHFGLPTRILDWTYSPFIAMHFATAAIDKFDLDGAIWAVNYVKAHELLPQSLRDRLVEEGANVMTLQLMNESIDTLNDLDLLRFSMGEKVVIFLEPPSINNPIINRFPFCSVMSGSRPDSDGMR